jgi:2'-hydroxyisoflavone reductase
VQFVDVRDLAEWTIRVAEARTLGVFNAIGPAQPLTMRAMLSEIAAGIQTEPRLTWVSTDFLKAQKVSPWRDLPVWVPGHGDSAGFARRDIRRALDAGLVFRLLPQTAADTLAWFKTLPQDRQATLKAGLAAEREAALLANWAAVADK